MATVKTLTYDHRREERESWGEGPWIDEPDKVQWQDEATGLPCLVVRNHMGAWCGYVGVSEGHPTFDKSYQEIDGASQYDDDGNYTGDAEPIAHIDVHGGLTFGGFCVEDGKEHGICHIVEPGENDRVFWHGFDCAHAWDLVPSMEAMMRERGGPSMTSVGGRGMPEVTYKPIEFAREQCRQLAAQLAAVA